MSLLKEQVELKIEETELNVQKKFGGLPRAMRWYLFIAVLAMIPTYFICKLVSSKYWSNKYSGYILTAKPSFANASPPTISDILLFTQDSGSYSALVTVTNNNLDLSLDLTAYKINFYNDKNELVYSETDKLFLLPNQKKDIVIPKFTASDKIVSAQMVLPDSLNWQKRAQLPQVKLVAAQPDISFQSNPLAFAAEGNVYNNSPYNIKQVHLTFKVLNTNGNTVAVSQRDEFSLAPFERRGYKQLWPGLNSPGINSVAVSADTNILDPVNLSLPQAAATSASDLNRPETDTNQ